MRCPSSDTDDTDNELRDDHAHGAVNEDRTSPETLNHPEGEGRGAGIHECGNEGDEERVLDGPETLEEDGSEVKDEIDAGQLLHHLHEDPDGGSAGIAASLGDGTLEAIGPAADVAGLRDHLHLVLVVGNDLSQFVLDVFRVERLTPDVGQGNGGQLELALLDEVAGRFGEEEQTRRQDDGPEELHGDGNAVRPRIIAVLSGVHHAVGEENANGDAKLVPRHERAPDFLWCDL